MKVNETVDLVRAHTIDGSLNLNKDSQFNSPRIQQEDKQDEKPKKKY